MGCDRSLSFFFQYILFPQAKGGFVFNNILKLHFLFIKKSLLGFCISGEIFPVISNLSPCILVWVLRGIDLMFLWLPWILSYSRKVLLAYTKSLFWDMLELKVSLGTYLPTTLCCSTKSCTSPTGVPAELSFRWRTPSGVSSVEAWDRVPAEESSPSAGVRSSASWYQEWPQLVGSLPMLWSAAILWSFVVLKLKNCLSGDILWALIPLWSRSSESRVLFANLWFFCLVLPVDFWVTVFKVCWWADSMWQLWRPVVYSPVIELPNTLTFSNFKATWSLYLERLKSGFSVCLAPVCFLWK